MEPLTDSPPDATVPTSAVSPERKADAAQPCPPLRILVVEDNPDLCGLVCELLENFGHAATPTGSGEEALTSLAAAAFDVLLTDVRLPGMSGIDLARNALALRPEIQIIFASGYGAGLTANVDFPAHSLAKPYDIEKLQALLTEIRR